MASQTCEQCGAIAAGDEQFCPSCGAFMDPMTTPRPRPRPTSSGNVISVSSDGPSDSPYEEFSLQTPPTQDTPPRPQSSPRGGGGGNGSGNGGPVDCPSCGAVNPANNRHCQECGARLRQGPLPTAPRPAVQATAGVRAALDWGATVRAVDYLDAQRVRRATAFETTSTPMPGCRFLISRRSSHACSTQRARPTWRSPPSTTSAGKPCCHACSA